MAEKGHTFSEEYERRKAALLSATAQEDLQSSGTKSSSTFTRTAIIAAILAAALTLSVGAAVALTQMNIKKDGGKTTITASVGDKETGEKPFRTWDPTGDEVAVQLDFGWLPDDMTEDETAPYKFGSSESGRWMTLYGYDLRQKDLNYIITDTTETEEFTAGGHQAYIVRMAEVYSVNNLYVMFEEDDLVICGHVGKGITDEELTKIVEGMSLSETTDVSTALPIRGNDEGGEWFYPVKLPADAATEVGETYTDTDGRFTVTVDKIKVLDSFEGIDMADCRTDQIEPFVDGDGNLTEYQRIEAVWEDGVNALSHFGETKTVKKYLVTADFTYTNTKNEKDDVWVLDSHIFSDGKDYRIGETRNQAQFSEAIYVSGSSKTGEDSPYIREIDAGETITFTLGWLVDEDWLDDAFISVFGGTDLIVGKYDISKETEDPTALPILPDEKERDNYNGGCYLNADEAFRNKRDKYTVSIDSVSVAYDVKALDPDDCRMEIINEFTDEQGNFIEYDRTEVVYENGENKISHYEETVKAKKMLVTADFTYTNTGKDKAVVYAFDSCLEYIGTKLYVRKEGYCNYIGYYGFMNTPVYFSGWGESGEESPYDRLVDAGETIHFTLGWLIDEDLFDKGAAIKIKGGHFTTIAYYNLKYFDIK